MGDQIRGEQIANPRRHRRWWETEKSFYLASALVCFHLTLFLILNFNWFCFSKIIVPQTYHAYHVGLWITLHSRQISDWHRMSCVYRVIVLVWRKTIIRGSVRKQSVSLVPIVDVLFNQHRHQNCRLPCWVTKFHWYEKWDFSVYLDEATVSDSFQL